MKELCETINFMTIDYFCFVHLYLHLFILVGLYSPIGSALECEASVLRSIHSYIELKMCITWADNMHYGLGRCLIHESQDLAPLGQHDLRSNVLNKGNTYLCY